MTAQTVRTYRKKPVDIRAQWWDGTATGATQIIGWILAGGGTARYHEAVEQDDEVSPAFIAIDTLEGTMRLYKGSYAIRGVHGEFYPCKPDIFAQTYDEPEPAAPRAMSATVQVRVVAEGQPVTGLVVGTVNLVAPPQHVDEVREVVTRALRGGRMIS